jgi:colicin import membrane protein
MNKPFALLALCLATLSGCTLLPPSVTPVVPVSTSVEQATHKLEQVAIVRAAVEREYAASEQVCYHKFFVNNCLDAAKEKRRVALAYQGAIEDEAQYYRRKAAVDERDRDVAKAVKEFEVEEARAAAQPAPVPRTVVERVKPAPKATLSARNAKREAKQAQRAEQELADAPKRAANVKAFEQRKLDAEKRQREVAEKLAKKDAKKAAKAAEEAK